MISAVFPVLALGDTAFLGYGDKAPDKEESRQINLVFMRVSGY